MVHAVRTRMKMSASSQQMFKIASKQPVSANLAGNYNYLLLSLWAWEIAHSPINSWCIVRLPNSQPAL